MIQRTSGPGIGRAPQTPEPVKPAAPKTTEAGGPGVTPTETVKAEPKPAAPGGAGESAPQGKPVHEPSVDESVGRMRMEQLYAQQMKEQPILQLENAKKVLDKLITSIHTGDSQSYELQAFTDHVKTVLEGADPLVPSDVKLMGNIVQTMSDKLKNLELHPPTGNIGHAASRQISQDAAKAQEALGQHVRDMAERFNSGK